MVKPFVRGAVRDPDHVRLLSSPVRQEVVDTLAALGGQASIAAMAEHLGRPADGLYYHMRALVESGLVTSCLERLMECFASLCLDGGCACSIVTATSEAACHDQRSAGFSRRPF